MESEMKFERFNANENVWVAMVSQGGIFHWVAFCATQAEAKNQLAAYVEDHAGMVEFGMVVHAGYMISEE